MEGHQDGWGPVAHCVEVVTVRTGFILDDRRYLTAAFNYLMGSCGGHIARLFWDVHSDRRKAQVQFTKREILILYYENSVQHEDSQILELVVQSSSGISTCGETQKSAQIEQPEQC